LRGLSGGFHNNLIPASRLALFIIVFPPNEQPQVKPCNIEDASLKFLCMRGNKSPTTLAGNAPKGYALKRFKDL
jgi:hypothetical protein